MGHRPPGLRPQARHRPPERLRQLRQPGGLSGYPSRAESPHDWIENSHASTVMSYAHGSPSARDRQGDHQRHIVAVIGDGSMTGGMAYERSTTWVTPTAGCSSCSTTTGAAMPPPSRSSPQPGPDPHQSALLRRQQARIEQSLTTCPSSAGTLERGMEASRPPCASMSQPHAFFENLGVRYVGPIDGHDVGAMEQTLRNACCVRRPDRGARAHPEGPGLFVRRRRRRKAPPRHRCVRPDHRPAKPAPRGAPRPSPMP